MEIKKNFDIKSTIIEVMGKNDHATAPVRFHLPFDTEQLAKLLGVCYKAEVIKRVDPAKYQNLSPEMKTNIARVTKWLCDPNKRPGLLLYGGVGTGKTTLLQAVVRVINTACCKEKDDNGKSVETLNGKPIAIVKAKEIVKASFIDPQRYDLMTNTTLLAIDELGVEPVESKLFGNTSEPIVDLLCERYDRQRCTLISTNLSSEIILERYGKRVSDRFNEMFTAVPFTAESYRV